MSALAIAVRWHDTLISQAVLREGERRHFTVGAGDADVAVSRAGQANFFFDEDGPGLQFSSGVQGEVWRNGETPLAMGDVIHRGLAEENGSGWRLPLGRRDGVVLRFGTITVEAVPTKAPQLVSGASGALDYRWLNVLLATAMAATLLVMHFELSAIEGHSLDEDGLSAAAVTMRRVLVKPPPPTPAQAAVQKTETTDAPKKRVAEAGSPAKKPASRGTGAGIRAAPIDVRSMFSGLGKSGLFGDDVASKELSRALGSVVAMNDGPGGWALKGGGGGGDVGGPLQLGRLGVPRERPFGRGDPVLKRLASETPTIDVSPPVITCERDVSDCIDREMIRKVVREHVAQLRYCYESLLSTQPNLEGRVSVKWHVTGAGVVDSAQVVSSPSVELGTCLAGRVRTWVFPATKRVEAGFVVTYPFTFKRSG